MRPTRCDACATEGGPETEVNPLRPLREPVRFCAGCSCPLFATQGGGMTTETILLGMAIVARIAVPVGATALLAYLVFQAWKPKA